MEGVDQIQEICNETGLVKGQQKMPDNHKDYQDPSYIIHPQVPFKLTFPDMGYIVQVDIIPSFPGGRNAGSIYITAGGSLSSGCPSLCGPPAGLIKLFLLTPHKTVSSFLNE